MIIAKTDQFTIEKRIHNGHKYYVAFVPGGWNKFYTAHDAFTFCYSFCKRKGNRYAY